MALPPDNVQLTAVSTDAKALADKKAAEEKRVSEVSLQAAAKTQSPLPHPKVQVKEGTDNKDQEDITQTTAEKPEPKAEGGGSNWAKDFWEGIMKALVLVGTPITKMLVGPIQLLGHPVLGAAKAAMYGAGELGCKFCGMFTAKGGEGEKRWKKREENYDNKAREAAIGGIESALAGGKTFLEGGASLLSLGYYDVYKLKKDTTPDPGAIELTATKPVPQSPTLVPELVAVTKDTENAQATASALPVISEPNNPILPQATAAEASNRETHGVTTQVQVLDEAARKAEPAVDASAETLKASHRVANKR